MKILSSPSTIKISFNIKVDANIEPTETVTILSKLLRSEVERLPKIRIYKIIKIYMIIDDPIFCTTSSEG